MEARLCPADSTKSIRVRDILALWALARIPGGENHIANPNLFRSLIDARFQTSIPEIQDGLPVKIRRLLISMWSETGGIHRFRSSTIPPQRRYQDPGAYDGSNVSWRLPALGRSTARVFRHPGRRLTGRVRRVAAKSSWCHRFARPLHQSLSPRYPACPSAARNDISQAVQWHPS